LAAHETYRGGKDVISIKTGDRNGKVVSVYKASKECKKRREGGGCGYIIRY
jgi:hypothetical protein